MTPFLFGLLALGVLYVVGVYLARANTKALADGLIKTVGVLLCGFGAILLFVGGRFSIIALPFVLLGVSLLVNWPFDFSKPIAARARPSGRASSVKSRYFDMTLDHESGAMDGTVLAGMFAGRSLSSLSENELKTLYSEVSARNDDPDSLSLVEAYLDSVVAGWRENFHANHNAGHGGSSGSGPITEEEAYEILGLSPGASTEAIRSAHRSLMLKLHPDRGGSTLLAAKINEAKDVLLRNHDTRS